MNFTYLLQVCYEFLKITFAQTLDSWIAKFALRFLCVDIEKYGFVYQDCCCKLVCILWWQRSFGDWTAVTLSRLVHVHCNGRLHSVDKVAFTMWLHIPLPLCLLTVSISYQTARHTRTLVTSWQNRIDMLILCMFNDKIFMYLGWRG